MKKSVYFDNAAAAAADQEILQLYLQLSTEYFANAEAIHTLAYRARQALQSAAKRLSSALFGSSDHPVIWGNSATELFRVAASFDGFESSCASVLEHPSLLANLRNFTRLNTLNVTPAAQIDNIQLSECVDLASLYQVQSELGAIQQTSANFDKIAPRCRMIDAVQAAGKIPMDKNADIWIISGVKFGAPGGAAMVLAPDGAFTDKLLAHAEKCRRENYAVSRISVPMMLAMTAALEKAVGNMTENFRMISELNHFIRCECLNFGIVPTLPETVAVSPYILNLLLPTQESAVVIRALGERGVYAAAGSACSAESRQPSAALSALGLPPKKAFRALRLSFGTANRMEDAEIFLAELKTVLKNY